MEWSDNFAFMATKSCELVTGGTEKNRRTNPDTARVQSQYLTKQIDPCRSEPYSGVREGYQSAVYRSVGPPFRYGKPYATNRTPNPTKQEPKHGRWLLFGPGNTDYPQYAE